MRSTYIGRNQGRVTDCINAGPADCFRIIIFSRLKNTGLRLKRLKLGSNVLSLAKRGSKFGPGSNI